MSTSIKIDKRFKKKVKGVFEKYEFQVGILNDGAHRGALSRTRGLSSYAGGPVRKKSRISTQSISEVSENLRKNTGIEYLTAPFRKKSSDITKFANEFIKLAIGKSEKKRVENLLQAVVRNPILRGDYGSNSKVTKIIKGFNRFMIDTGQLFKAIRAKAIVRSKGV